eukprot:TRINITY_DN13664_c0_g1_i4.p1 TRINITY_DN13664_c0_g1~~TRINITY_DN13664_c0_g1_i4.p1  ORF type:complete len:230 (+),score=25.03 TRINITY_DN13664_c0_g1_i4:199-888(+)
MDITTETTPPKPKPLSFTNGVLKKHHPIHLECLKNHAASLGGHALDGCGEFMPSPTSSPADPTSLKCAACGCHRNFHRRDPHPHHHHHHDDMVAPSSKSPSPPPYFPSAPQMLLALSTGVAAAGDDDDRTVTRKRFRTKFSKDQKEKMLSFSERLGWKMQKKDEGMIEEFCSEVGVGKGVFKVWMHNNKHNLKRGELMNSSSGNNVDVDDDHLNNNNETHLTNGSSSSS